MLKPAEQFDIALTEHYLAASPTIPYIGPRVATLVNIQFEYATDPSIAVRKWQELGFIQVNPCHTTSIGPIGDRSHFVFEAAALGASVVLATGWPAPPQVIYLAPTSHEARVAGKGMPDCGSTTFEQIWRLPLCDSYLETETYEAARILLDDTSDLEKSVGQWENAGFVTLGSADAVLENDLMGYTQCIANTALTVGATLVTFQTTRAKKRRIRRLDDGHIDIDFVQADPPASMLRRGISVVQAVFLAPTSVEARASSETTLHVAMCRLPLSQ
jgi:hypothetical protein